MRKLNGPWRWVIAGCGALLFYFFVWRDPFVQLSVELSRNPMWLTGFFGTSDAPLTATPEEILQPSLRGVSSNRGAFSPFHIQRTGHVFVFNVEWGALAFYPAALIDSPGGEAIVLYRHHSGEPDVLHPKVTEWWWTKIYDLPL